MDEIDERIRQAENGEATLYQAWIDQKDVVRALKLEKIYQDYRVKEGSVCIHTTDQCDFLVSDIEPHTPHPWLSGYLQKKDGEWSKRKQNFYRSWKRKDG